jgi:hypothetical protein
MRAYAQHSLLLELGLVRVDQFSNSFLGRCVIGTKDLEDVSILSNDFTVRAAPLA